MSYELLKRQIVRNSILCQAIEPFGDKSDCTTKYNNSSEGTKLEYFTISAVNSSWAFYDLVDGIIKQKKQPECIFKYAYLAQKYSTQSRWGSKVNYGQIQMLIPLITSQVLFYIENQEFDAKKVAHKSIAVLKNTTISDVEYLERFINLGYEISYLHHKKLAEKDAEQKYFENESNHNNIWELAQEFRSIHIIDEMSSGYPLSLEVFSYIKNNYHRGLIKCTEEIYPIIKKQVSRFDAAADIIVIGIYLALSSLKNKKIFR